MEQRTITANGLEFACLTEGPEDGPLALCLHGFPDSAHTWRYLLPELAGAGFRAVAPFLRGYAPTAIPADGRYQVGALVRDANALHEVLGGGADAVIVGHDWGALATYGAVAHQPDRWRRAVTAAVPPTASIGMSLFTYAQLQKSWYMFFFLSPLAEVALPLDDYSFIDHLWRDWSPGYDGTWDVARVKESIGDPEHMVAAIGYYRALYDPSLQVPELADEQAAALLPDAEADALSPRARRQLHAACPPWARRSTSWPRAQRVEVVDDAGHFLHVERPDVVNRHIIEVPDRS